MNEYLIDISGKNALKVGKIPSLKVIRPNRTKLLLHNVCEIFQMFVQGRGHERPPTIQSYTKVCKSPQICEADMFVSFQQITFKLGSFADLKLLF